MESLVKNAFVILGTCVVSLLMWRFIFIDGKPLFLNAIEPQLEYNWSLYTMNDGRDMDTTLTREFNSVVDLTTR